MNQQELFDSAPYVELPEEAPVHVHEERAYQAKVIADLRAAVASGSRSPLVVMPTGAGKTITARDIIQSSVSKGNKILFLAPRRELIYQSSSKLDSAGIDHGIIMAGEQPTHMSPVQVASVPTLYMRAEKRQVMPYPEASLVIIDEAHLARADSVMKVLAAYPNAIKIGLTATPCRKDGRGLGEVFDHLVLGPSVQELIDQHYLVGPKYFVPSSPDLKGVAIQDGDYNQVQLGKRMLESQTIVGDVLTNWQRLASNRKTVVFTVNVAHSLAIEQAFKQAGIKIAHIDADTPLEERRTILKNLESGRIQVVTNCDVLTLGWDCPSVSCCVLARPTKSLVRYMQAVGRALRPHPGKDDCLILDHGGCVEEHGPVEDHHEWSLDSDKTIAERDLSKKREKKAPKDVICQSCKMVFRGKTACPGCGWCIPHGKSKVHSVEDDLAEYKGKKRFVRVWSPEEKSRFHAELRGYAKEKSYAPGWVWWTYKDKFGEAPTNSVMASAPPSPETRAWLKHRAIRRSYAQRAAQRKGAA